MTTLVTGELLRRPLSSRAWTRHRRVGGAIIMGIVLLTLFPLPLLAEESSEPKSTRMTCGSCPDGYAMTGTTSDAKICKDGDPTLVQCVPLEPIFSRYAALVRMAIVRSAIPQTRLGVGAPMGGV